MSTYANDSAGGDRITGSMQLEAIYRTAPVGLCVLDADLRYVRINERLAEINGLPASDHIGRTVRDVIPRLADDVEPLMNRVLETGEAIRDLKLTGETAAQPGVTRTWNESWFPLKDADGRVVGINIVAEEITESIRAKRALEESEERFRTALTNAPIVFAHVNRELRYEWVFNPHPDFDVDSVIGKRDDELSEGPGIDALIRLKRKAFEDGIQVREQLMFMRSSGPQWYDITATPVRGSDGKIDHLVTAATDVTILKRTEEALASLNETLSDRVRERTRQVRTLAFELTLAEHAERRRIAERLHDDLQQQLYALQLVLDMIRTDIGSSDGSDWRNLLDQSYGYVEDALTTVRYLTVDLSPPVLVGEGLTEALRWLSGQMKERFDLTVDLKSDRNLSIPRSDIQVLLFHLVRELLFNVVKHAGVNHVSVSLTESGDSLVIEVSDEGAGMDPAILETVRADRNGFGLHHARERIGLVGGRMDVVSAPDEGTRITVSMPIEQLDVTTVD